jgi:hypothetical protein
MTYQQLYHKLVSFLMTIFCIDQLGTSPTETLQNDLDKLAQWGMHFHPSMLILYLEVSPKKNPNNFCAFDAMLFMCAFQVMLDELVIPRYFVVSTDSRMCHSKMLTFINDLPAAVSQTRLFPDDYILYKPIRHFSN